MATVVTDPTEEEAPRPYLSDVRVSADTVRFGTSFAIAPDAAAIYRIGGAEEPPLPGWKRFLLLWFWGAVAFGVFVTACAAILWLPSWSPPWGALLSFGIAGLLLALVLWAFA